VQDGSSLWAGQAGGNVDDLAEQGGPAGDGVVATGERSGGAQQIGLLALFLVGSLLCAVATAHAVLMRGRVLAALCHDAFFGIGSVVAANMVAADRKRCRRRYVHRVSCRQRVGCVSKPAGPLTTGASRRRGGVDLTSFGHLAYP
jgi:hypothetical protein